MKRGRKPECPPPPAAIKPGEVRNPGGMPIGLVELRKHGAKELAEKMHALMKCNKEALVEVTLDPSSDMLTVALARIMIQAAETGDITKLNFIVERVAGSVPKQINVNAQVNNTTNEQLAGLSDEDLRAMQEIMKKASPTKEEE